MMRLSEDGVRRQKKLCGCCAVVDNTLRLRGLKCVCAFRCLWCVCKISRKTPERIRIAYFSTSCTRRQPVSHRSAEVT